MEAAQQQLDEEGRRAQQQERELEEERAQRVEDASRAEAANKAEVGGERVRGAAGKRVGSSSDTERRQRRSFLMELSCNASLSSLPVHPPLLNHQP